MQRRLRVCRLLPPRKCLGAHSSRRTLLPARRAVMAAHSAALPPPNTRTSYMRKPSRTQSFARRVSERLRRPALFLVLVLGPGPQRRERLFDVLGGIQAHVVVHDRAVGRDHV